MLELFPVEPHNGEQSDGRELLPNDGSAKYYGWCLGNLNSDEILKKLIAETPWEQPKIFMFGEISLQPRLVAWYGDPEHGYTYSGVKMNVLEWTPLILQLKDLCESYAKCKFNSVLLNYYRDGQDKVAWHSDNEHELGVDPIIASLSLGAKRRFKFRKRLDHKVATEVALENGSLVVMSGLCQYSWEHEVPRETKVNQPRINLTFRQVSIKDRDEDAAR